MTQYDSTPVLYVYKGHWEDVSSPSSHFVSYTSTYLWITSDWLPHPSSWLPLCAERDSTLSERSLSLVETCWTNHLNHDSSWLYLNLDQVLFSQRLAEPDLLMASTRSCQTLTDASNTFLNFWHQFKSEVCWAGSIGAFFHTDCKVFNEAYIEMNDSISVSSYW
jgi:hypothetical protein